jgi:hypothetical protein
MDPLLEWIDELSPRPDNIDPIRRIPNGAPFQGTPIKGSRRLNKPQRIGAFRLGFGWRIVMNAALNNPKQPRKD